jgi:hypothetical protein
MLPTATSFNNLRYDVNTYQFDLRQSVGPGEYTLGTPTPHCQPCFADDARMNLGTTGGADCDNVPLVDVESDLHNVGRRATNCPTGHYLPKPPCTLKPYDNCTRQTLPAADTRLNNPPATLRGTGWNRWEWLCMDPQARALVPFDFNVDTTIVAKDNHRPHIARPLDQTAAMPPAKYVADPSVGAPHWQPACLTPNNDPPTMHWRSCEEVDAISNGMVARKKS